MDIQKYMVLLKGEDKTGDIFSYSYINGWQVEVRFIKPNKSYTYAKSNFEFLKDPVELNIDDVSKSLISGDLFNVKKILRFDNYCRIIFNDNSYKTVPASYLKLGDKVKEISEDRFKYFKEISKIVSVKTEEGTALLTKEYEKVNFVEKDTALYQYLNPHENRFQNIGDTPSLVFPFGSNKSQYNAVENAMNYQISVIEGPPGTGKTQTILNIISNIILRGKTVAVVSNNNSATANVLEKLESCGYGFLCAFLGRKENKELFIKNQTGLLPVFRDTNIVDRKEIDELNKRLLKAFEFTNARALARDELEQIRVQQEYFNNNEKDVVLPTIKNISKFNSTIISNFIAIFEDYAENNKKLSFGLKAKLVWIYKLGNFKFYKKPINEIIKAFNKLFFMVREYQLKIYIGKCSSSLVALNSDNLMNELKKKSNDYLYGYLKNKYHNKEQREIYNQGDLYSKSTEFLKDYPIIFSTTYSIKSCLNQNIKYDYIIMDEASQVDLITGTLALSCAKNAVIVGDRKQLPNVVSQENRDEIIRLSEEYRIGRTYNFLNECFLTSVLKSIPHVPCVLLREHYRCHPKIIQFSNKKFYDNQLVVLTEDKEEKDVIKVFITAEGNHARGHFNQRQMDVIKEEVLPELAKKVDSSQIGIVSPYNAQKDGLIDLKLNDGIQIDTVHKYQGREKDAIIITTVDNQISEFVDDPKLLNVAITRAKKYLRLVVSKDICNTNSNLNDLIKYIQYNNFELVDSKIKSIYDLLYKANREARLTYLKNKKRISEYDSENLTYDVIQNIIKKKGWNNLDVVTHIPLSSLLKDMDQLSEEELRYASNDWTHVDFVIYNKMDNMMVMAVEVDGYAFHNKSTRQSERDVLKNSILQKYDVPLVRLSTLGNSEARVLEEKMYEVFEQKTFSL